MRRAVSLAPALALLAAVAAGALWRPPWMMPTSERGAMAPAECGRLLTAVIEGALRKGEALKIEPPPGCSEATFRSPYAIASADGGAVLLRFNEVVARFTPRQVPTSARRTP